MNERTVELLTRIEFKRLKCEWFNPGTEYCEFYAGLCFHKRNNICYKIRPRTKFMPWMGDLCSDCNEPVCNLCDMYIEFTDTEYKSAEVV